MKEKNLPSSIIKLEHYQEQGKEHRGNYLVGLALDCYLHPENDRNSHYLARELMWTGRPQSAIKEFIRHISMNKWPAERAQSAIFIGDCYGKLNVPEKQIEWYNVGFYIDPNRREALIKIASFYLFNKQYIPAIAYLKAALEIPWTDYYANDVSHYKNYPHELLYTCYGWIGNIPEAQKHINIALEYQPLNSTYLRDLRYYYKLPTVSFIIPTLGREEGLKRCMASIYALNYPLELIDIRVIEGDETVPWKVVQGVTETHGEIIVYASNDCEFTPDSLILAVKESMDNKKRLIAFDTGVRNNEGYICEHFMIYRSLLPEIGGEMFDTDFKHYCVDDLLWKKCEKLGEAMISKGKVNHYHYSRIGSGFKKDWVIERASQHFDEDRQLLEEKLKLL